MFSRNCPDPLAHWLVMRYPSTFARLSTMTARACRAPTSTTRAHVGVEVERPARVGGHAVEVTGAERDDLAFARRRHVVELVAAYAGRRERRLEGGLGHGQGVAPPQPLAVAGEERLAPRGIAPYDRHLDGRGADVDPGGEGLFLRVHAGHLLGVGSRDAAHREERGAEGARVDRVGRDVDRACAVVLAHELRERLHGLGVLRHAAGERELLAHAPGAGQQRHGPQHDRAVQPRQDVLAPLAERESVTKLRAGEDGARRVDSDAPRGLPGERAELVEPEVHLVGDVAEVPAAPGRAAVVHLERGHDAVVVDLDGLRVLASDVEDRSRAGEELVGAEAVAEDLRTDRASGKGSRARP